MRFITDILKNYLEKEEYESEARQLRTGRVLRSIVNQSSAMTDNIMTDNTMTTMTDNIMTENTMTTITDNTMTDNTMTAITDNTMTPTYDRAIRNMKS